MQLDWLDGEMTDQCGQDRHPANHSRQQESKTAQVTSDIYGLSGSISSGSADLQSFLENRLARRLHSAGLTNSKLTESSDYSCGAILVPASGVGALHNRDRLWFVAHADFQRWKGFSRERKAGVTEHSKARNLAYPSSGGLSKRPAQANQWGKSVAKGREVWNEPSDSSNTDGGRSCQAVQCKDGKVRLIPTEPEIFPLANGIPNRVGILRGAGNAIVPQVAAEIISCFTGADYGNH